ncbi:MAG: amino acid adenylation domain-containing protein [Clostridia bacterium]|nr:amino acid adenylation domain-containing protein [Clostridia bacterium]
MHEFETLTELLASRKDEEQKGITFILGNTEEICVSYKELYHTALRLLYDFQNAGFKAGDEVIFQIDDNQRFVYSFWACILGGMIPVPVTTGTNDEHKLKFFKIWKVLLNPRVIATVDFLEKLESFAVKNNLADRISIIKDRAVRIEDEIQTVHYGIVHTSRPNDIAFIQFSSGSTGDPKGVVITHSNVLINLTSVIKWANINSEDSGLNWMPLTHDMGLIGTHIKGIIACINQYNIETQVFIRHPSLWIQKASEHKVTILYSPNFGYKHFLKFFKPDAEKDWDLSNIRLIYNGAEPISLELCSEFLGEMAKFGLRKNAMYPVYGLAEGTIAVTFPGIGEEYIYHTLDRNHLKVGEHVVDIEKEDRCAVTFIDEGYPIFNCYVRICDENNNDLGENRIGLVQIRGGNVTSGYYNNKAATVKAFTPDGWLNTGDLGFMRNKRLVITGRAKDVIFIAGQNYYSHDIERVGECVEGIELGKIAAAGVFNEKLKSDELILFVMFKQKAENFMPIAASLKKAISQKMGIEVSEVIPVKSIPKTTSGKVQRYKLREGYINGEYDSIKNELHNLKALEFDRRKIELPKNAVEEELVRIWTEILGYKKIGIHDNFFELGGDSLRITQLISRIRDTFGLDMDQAEIFDHPDIEKLADRIKSNMEKHAGGQEMIKAVFNDSNKAPLSFAQQRLWFLDAMNEKSPQYNLYTCLSLKGHLDRDILERGFNEVIRRHKVLQMSFIEENGQPVQVFNPDAVINIEYMDLRHFNEAERGKRVLDLANEEANRPFDLGKVPLIKAKLYCMDENEHLLLLVVHHIVFDGWSFGIFLKELTFYYETFLLGNGKMLPELDIQYADFARWQIDKAAGDSFKKQLDYWKKQLAGKLPVLDLPTDRQRPLVQTYNGAKFTSSIPGDLARELQSYARKENSTLFMVLLAAFKVMLYRYTGQTDIIVGSPIANRNRKDIEGLIGFFANNIVLRTGFSGKYTFNELLKNVKRVTLEAYKNQDVPFEKLVEELNNERDISRNPLFQVLFSLQNTPLPNMEFSEINVSQVNIAGRYSRFDIALDIREIGDELAVDYEYNTDLFDKDTVVRMAGHFRQLLNEIAKNPYDMICKLEMLTKEEKHILLEERNDTKEDFSGITSWVELFEKQADRIPEATAAVCGGESILYGELHKRSNQLANYLISLGVGPESVVGVYIDRSLEMLVGLVGVHKAGAAYMPMDPIFPKERLTYMLEDARVETVLSERKLALSLPFGNARVICLDEAWDEISAYSKETPGKKSGPHNLAYLIYTSGSTGKPKGVQIEQFALVNFLMSMAEKTGFGEKDSLLAVTTLSFDIAGLELFMPLSCGAKVVIAKRDEVTDGSMLMSILNEQHISMMQATPATWRLLIESGWSGNEVLKVLCGGEALQRNLAGQLLERCESLYNVYGPTETTIWSTLAKVEPGEGSVTIGKPISNTKVYVLDKAMNAVPVGVPGELYIGGDGVARGYLNLPELTKEKFIKDPFSKNENARLYKTGDSVRFMPDGSLDFIGRMDNQVKIRGFRIELGEIEALLNGIPEVMESVIAVKEIIAGEKSLAAYIIPVSDKDREKLSSEYLRKSLKEKLPDYMVPAAFMLMDSFPMTPNGKIDRKALPIPESLRSGIHANYAAPSGEVEKTIVSIWQEVLKREHIGVNDNFFDLGGHSLLLAQVRNKIRNVLNKEISMIDLFKYPTVDTLAKFLGGESQAEVSDDCGRIKSGKVKSKDIAVIGLSGRFPGAKDVNEFWENLLNGVESISRFTDEQVLHEGVEPEILKKPGYVKAWGALDNIDRFDANFFGYNPTEAEVLDPQQRIFLEESWKALENAGYEPEKFNGLIGVYASVGMNTYAQLLKNSHASKGLASDYQIMISNDKDFLSTRVAYKLNLQGPGLTVQTACSSSLVAVHLACQSLINGECDMALTGGVSIRLPQRSGYLYQEGMILSPDGHCKAFDEEAKGTVGGNGAGVVVLKRLEDAMADGDDISAVIKGSAINNDGALKIGYTAPRIDGQAKAIEKAQLKAGVQPETITYIEAHGTGTPLGDPIEIEALTQVFNKKTDKKQFCAIGSVKTNIGHLDAAAGVTGFIKAVLSLRNKQIPPSINYTSPNPKINFKDSPFFVNTSLKVWENGSTPLRAGVSSFGIGGTNAHVVLEEAPVLKSDKSNSQPCLLVFSAKNARALDRITTEFTGFLRENKHLDIADIAFTLQLGRKEFEYRRFLVCNSVEDAIEALENKRGRIVTGGEGQPASNSKAVLDDIEKLSLKELGNLWLEGARIDWSKLYKGQNRKRVALPTYPFEGQSYWTANKSIPEIVKPAAKTVKQNDISQWFYAPVWKQSVEDFVYDKAGKQEEILLVLTGENSFAKEFIGNLINKGANVIAAVYGKGYANAVHGNFTFNADDYTHYDNILGDMSNKGKVPARIINLLGITDPGNPLTPEDSLTIGKRLFYSMLYLAQALGRQSVDKPIQMKVITNNSQKIFNEKITYPEKALHLGACRVIPKEYPNIQCSSIDITLPESGNVEEQDIIELLTSEIYWDSNEAAVAYRGLTRWVQEFDKYKPQTRDNPAVKIRNNGVYLITGGLGGMGLVIAEHLAFEAGARLVLIGRSEFPVVEHWEAWLSSHGTRDAVSQKIIRLKQLIAQGADILICRADVSDFNQLSDLRKCIEERFGGLNGVIHAAGNPGGGMIQLKTKESAEQVLLPKVKGTMALYETFKDDSLDFFLFCSSLNAITGGFGQIDYSAANAYLDAFALTHDSLRETRFVSVDWDRWPGVGMASGTGKLKAIEGEAVHPLLGKCIAYGSDKIIYLGEMSPEKDWVLSEHLVMGVPTIAGTTYLEMARAALEDTVGAGCTEISQVLFLNPMAVKTGEKRQVCTIMSKDGDAFNFQVASSLIGEEPETANWLEHVRGRIRLADGSHVKAFDMKELRERCGLRTLYSADFEEKPSEEFISFGARWRSLKTFTMGDSEGLVEVEMVKEFASDLEALQLHPALLDVATGAVRLAAGGNYLPFSYEKLEIKSRLPGRIYAYIRFKNGYDSSQDVITCDIDILDEKGNQLVEIKNFSMRHTGETAAQSIKSRASTGSREGDVSSLGKLLEGVLKKRSEGLNEGITSDEGKNVLQRILNGCIRPQVIVSTKDIHAAMEQADYINQPGLKNTFEEAAASSKRHPRPELENEYVAPKNELEKKLAQLWENTLGIDKVGIHDEFFALGGDSLLLIQFHSKLKEMFETDIAVVDLYKYNTVALLSKQMARGSTLEEQPAFEGVNNRVNKQLEMMKQRRQQLMRRKEGV